jgi:hypothetical protein
LQEGQSDKKHQYLEDQICGAVVIIVARRADGLYAE